MSAQHIIVVGVDGSDGGRRALAWALEHAATTGATVQVVSAYDGGDPTLIPFSNAQDEAEQMQEADVAAALAACDPAPVVAREVVSGGAVAVLTAAAQDAAMLVVGSRGRGHVRAALLGSVSEGCIRHGACPVLVVPTPKPAPRQRSVERSIDVGASAG